MTKKHKKTSRVDAYEVDLHAERYNEGKEKLTTFMREAYSKKHSPVRIIHGRGEGVMRSLAYMWVADNIHKVGREVDEGPSLLIYFRY